MVIDCPPAAADVACGYLTAAGIDGLDSLIVTHNDLDHLGGAYVVARRFATRRLYWNYGAKAMPSDVHKARKLRAALRGILDLRDVGTEKLDINRGDSGGLGQNVTWHALSPTQDVLIEALLQSDSNLASVVLRLHVGPWCFLIPGDAECFVWNDMEEARCVVKADVLLVPHHGAYLAPAGVATGIGWILDKVSPRFCVVSAGKGYGHPHVSTTTALNERAPQLRTLYTREPENPPGPRGDVVFEVADQLTLRTPHGP
jgi:competence protein ComEC